MASFVLSFFPLDVLDEIWDLIESVSEGFLTYSSMAIALIIACSSKEIWVPCAGKTCNLQSRFFCDLQARVQMNHQMAP